MSKIDKEILLQTLRGYAEVNKITEAENRQRLAVLTHEQSQKIFEMLYDVWERTGKKAGGNLEALRAQDLEAHIEVRKAFEALALHKGLI